MSDIAVKPPIALSHSDFSRLSLLAESLVRRNSDLADQLATELVRADLFDDATENRDVVRMGSTVDYETGSGDSRRVTLVFPQNEDISAGRISVLTPVGVALVGLSVGDTMEWRKRDGSTQRLTVTRLLRPCADAA